MGIYLPVVPILCTYLLSSNSLFGSQTPLFTHLSLNLNFKKIYIPPSLQIKHSAKIVHLGVMHGIYMDIFD